MFHDRASFYGEDLLAPRPTPKLEDTPLSAVHDRLFYIFVAALHIGGHCSIYNLRTCHTIVTGTHLSWLLQMHVINFKIGPIVVFWAP
jgi:hypothetical protein